MSPHLLSASHLGQPQHRTKSYPSQEDWFQNLNCALRLGQPYPVGISHCLQKLRFLPHQRGSIPCSDSRLQQPGIGPPKPMPLTAIQSTLHQTSMAPLVGPHEDRPMSPFQAEPDWTP